MTSRIVNNPTRNQKPLVTSSGVRWWIRDFKNHPKSMPVSLRQCNFQGEV